MDCHDRINSIREKVDKQIGKDKAGDKVASPQNELRDRLKAASKVVKDLIEESKASRAQVDEFDAKKKTVIEAIKKSRAEATHKNVEEIDRDIARVEEQINSGALKTLKEEKDAVSRVNALRMAKKSFSDTSNLSAQADQLEVKKKEALARAKAVSEKITSAKEVEGNLRDQLNKMQEAAKANRSDVPALIKLRDEVRKELNQHLEAQKALRDNIEKAYAEWKAYRAKSDKLQRQEKDLQRLVRRAQAAARGEAAAAEGEEGEEGEDKDAKPASKWATELTVCRDLIQYIRRLLPQQAKSEPASKTAAAPSRPLSGADSGKGKSKDVIIGPHSTAEDESLIFLPKAKAKKEKKVVAPADPATVKLTHNFDTLLFFTTVEVDVPLTAGQLPAALEAVQARLAYYETDPPKPEKKEGDKPKQDKPKQDNKASSSASHAPETDGPKAIDKVATPSGAWAKAGGKK